MQRAFVVAALCAGFLVMTLHGAAEAEPGVPGLPGLQQAEAHQARRRPWS